MEYDIKLSTWMDYDYSTVDLTDTKKSFVVTSIEPDHIHNIDATTVVGRVMQIENGYAIVKKLETPHSNIFEMGSENLKISGAFYRYANGDLEFIVFQILPIH